MIDRSRVLALVALGLAACAGDGDAYTLRTAGAPLTYAAAQDGDGAWQQLTLDASGHATFEVTRGFHGVVAHCGWSPLVVRFDAGAATPWFPCGDWATPVVEVSGAVNPAAASVWMGFYFSSRIDGTYRFELPPGRRDLMATSGDRALILRDQPFDADRTLDLDVDADGFALTPLTPTVVGNGANPVTACTQILTAQGTHAIISSTSFSVVPTARRVPGDRVVLIAQMAVDGRTQTVQREQTGETTPALTFEPLPELEIDRTGLRWSDGWEFTGVTYRPALGIGMGAHLFATAAWAEAAGATTVPLVDASTLPGWNASWDWPAAGTALEVYAWGSIGDAFGDYRKSAVDTSLTW